jgi:hypothetical protein
MSKKYIVIALAMILISAFGVVNLVRAQTPSPPKLDCPNDCQYEQQQSFYHMGGRGNRGTSNWENRAQGGLMGQGFLHEYMVAALAAVLDMPVDQLEQRLIESSNLGTIMEEMGIEHDTIYNLLVEARIIAIEQAAKDGIMDQELADWMLNRINLMQSFSSGLARGGCDDVGVRGFRHQGWGMHRSYE